MSVHDAMAQKVVHDVVALNSYRLQGQIRVLAPGTREVATKETGRLNGTIKTDSGRLVD